MLPYPIYLEEIPGKRVDATLYKEIETNYIFKKNRKRGDITYFTCWENGCNAKLIISSNSKKQKGFHNHELIQEKEKNLKFIHNCKKRAEESVIGFREIYEQEILRYFLLYFL